MDFTTGKVPGVAQRLSWVDLLASYGRVNDLTLPEQIRICSGLMALVNWVPHGQILRAQTLGATLELVSFTGVLLSSETVSITAMEPIGPSG